MSFFPCICGKFRQIGSLEQEFFCGVKGYTLDIVAKDKDAEGKVVGTCEGGTKKIIYSKGSAAPATPAKETPKP